SSLIELCEPSRNSGILEVVMTKILKNDTLATPEAVVQSSPETIEYIQQHPNAMGMIELNWLNDRKDSVKPLTLSDPLAPDSLGIRGKYYGPHQAYVYQHYYQLTTNGYIYLRADNY